jgi:hypothetical protein
VCGRWERDEFGASRFKVLIEMGWGPTADYGYQPSDWHWPCSLDIPAGRLVGIERCFSLPGQRVELQDEHHCAWHFTTAGRKVRDPFGMTQGMVFEVEGSSATRLGLRTEGLAFDLTAADMLDGSHLIPLIEESKRSTLETFGVGEGDLRNHDTYHHNARKIKVHRAIPESGYRVAHTFRNLQLAKGRNHFYVRVSQLNGQLAWSSPIWVDSR